MTTREEAFSRMRALLEAAAPEIFALDWTKYGSRYKLTDDAGNRKYQGMMLLVAEVSPFVPWVAQLGTLPDAAKTMKVVAAKVSTLAWNHGSWASIEHRVPEDWVYGGGIRYSDNGGTGGLSGLPEIGDHLLHVQGARRCGLLTHEDWKRLMGLGMENISALYDAGMTSEQYGVLALDLHQILERAGPAMLR